MDFFSKSRTDDVLLSSHSTFRQRCHEILIQRAVKCWDMGGVQFARLPDAVGVVRGRGDTCAGYGGCLHFGHRVGCITYRMQGLQQCSYPWAIMSVFAADGDAADRLEFPSQCDP